MTTVVVLAGGPDRPAVAALPLGATVIAADGGAELGGPVDLLVGDLDSISAETLAGMKPSDGLEPSTPSSQWRLGVRPRDLGKAAH
jgi:thiamine pyrophosphokinase